VDEEPGDAGGADGGDGGQRHGGAQAADQVHGHAAEEDAPGEYVMYKYIYIYNIFIYKYIKKYTYIKYVYIIYIYILNVYIYIYIYIYIYKYIGFQTSLTQQCGSPPPSPVDWSGFVRS